MKIYAKINRELERYNNRQECIFSYKTNLLTVFILIEGSCDSYFMKLLFMKALK